VRLCDCAGAARAPVLVGLIPLILCRYGYIRNVWSPQLNNSRDLVVYVPPSYAENPHKVRLCFIALHTASATMRWVSQVFDASSVLIMHDGQNLFNASTRYVPS